MSYIDEQTGERCAIGSQLPLTRDDWHAKRAAVDTVLDDIGGVVTRVGDETVGEMWSLYDGQDMLNEIDPRSPRTSAGTSPRSAARSVPRVGQHRPQG